MIKVSDYIIKRIEQEGVKHVFLVTGGGGMHLIDSLGRSEVLSYVPNHHEQASTLAAEAYSRIADSIGVALVTTGPAGTNALTGVGCAWTDSVPLLVLSGQAKTEHLIGNTGLRQKGFHEANISKIAEPITKYAVTILDPKTVVYHMEKALFLAKNGRPGPVWLDIPLDVQAANIDVEASMQFDPKKEYPELFVKEEIPEIKEIFEMLKNAKRPIILAGHGVKLSESQKAFLQLIEKLKIPVVTSRSAYDLLEYEHPYRAGFVGNFGQRAANFALQNSDLFISLGSRLAVVLVGYEPHLFAREAKKIVVDIDKAQLDHSFLKIDMPIQRNVKDVIAQMNEEADRQALPDYSEWMKKINHWKSIFPNVTEEMKKEEKYVSSYYFYEVLSEEMKKEDILVWDQGATFYCASIAFKVKKGQLAFSNVGFTPMGYGLPASVGVCFAAPGRSVVSVNGDGGLMMNVQELQTVVHFNLPMKIFVFSNDGYTSIKHTQQNFFNSFFVGVNKDTGLSCPDMVKLAGGFEIPAFRISNHSNMREMIKKALQTEGPVLVDVLIDPLEPIQPRVKSDRLPDGKMVSKPLEDMFPYLDRDLLKKEMIIKTIG